MSIAETQTPGEVEFDQYIFANKADPRLPALLNMFYQGVLDNTLGIMLAKNKETKQEEILLVGVEHEGDVTHTYPIARCFYNTDVSMYLAPDGEGGYFDSNEANELETMESPSDRAH